MESLRMLLLPWIYGPVVSLAVVALLFIAKRRIFKLVSRLAAHTATRMDDILLSAMSRPLNLVIIASGLLLLARLLPLPDEADRAIALGYTACIVAALVWFSDRLLAALLDSYSARVTFIGQARNVIQGLIRGLLAGMGILIVLDSMGISITPLIASLGVGSLAVALALQSSLANLFSGMYLLADKAIQPGQFIQLDSGEQGWVETIGWRSTRVRMISNVMLVVPNAKLVESTITNYGLPEEETALRIPVGVHYDSDLAHVERVTIEVARQVMSEVEGTVPGFDPYIRYQGFGDSSIDLTVVLRVQAYTQHFLVQHEFVKRLHARYRDEGIVIPFPMRTLDIPDKVLDRLAGGRQAGPGA